MLKIDPFNLMASIVIIFGVREASSHGWSYEKCIIQINLDGLWSREQLLGARLIAVCRACHKSTSHTHGVRSRSSMCVANELKLGGETVALIADNELGALRFAVQSAS